MVLKEKFAFTTWATSDFHAAPLLLTMPYFPSHIKETH